MHLYCPCDSDVRLINLKIGPSTPKSVSWSFSHLILGSGNPETLQKKEMFSPNFSMFSWSDDESTTGGTARNKMSINFEKNKSGQMKL